MTLEIVVNQYTVIEFVTREICDSPVIGASQSVLINKKEYGPYPSDTDAQRKIALLVLDHKSSGWQESKAGGLYKGDFDIHYKVQTSTRPF